MPSHFPGLSGSSRTFSSAVPYFAGANGFSICRVFPLRIARGITPVICGPASVDDFAPNVVFALKSCCANWRVAK